jgi:hypothetical protein
LLVVVLVQLVLEVVVELEVIVLLVTDLVQVEEVH